MPETVTVIIPDRTKTVTVSAYATLSAFNGLLARVAALEAGGGGGSMSAAAILAALLTVDGPASGLDADKLDGAEGSAYLTKAGNLSGLADVAAARTALGLGTLATQSGTFSGASSGTNTGDQDLSGLAVKSANLSDLTSASAARTNLGLGTLATQSGTFSGTSSGTNTGDQDLSGLAVKSANLSDLTSASAARTNLGLGTAATQAATAFAAATHAHSGTDITSGTVPIARLPTTSGGGAALDSGFVPAFGAAGQLAATQTFTLWQSALAGSSAISAENLTGTRTHYLPDANGTLATQEWATANISGGSPGGSTTQVQFNNSGSFGGVSGLTVNTTTGALTQSQSTDATTAVYAFTASTTATASSGNQKWSPFSRWTARGWGTTAGTSQAVEFACGVQPTQGTTPSGTWVLRSSINGGAWTNQITVTSGGTLTVTGTVNAGTLNASANVTAAGNLVLGGDLTIARAAAGTLRLGSSDSASPVAQIIRPQSISSGTSNTQGAVFTIQNSRGTGTGLGGDILFQTAGPGSSGTGQNAWADHLRLVGDAGKTSRFAGPVRPGYPTVSGLPTAASCPGHYASVSDAASPVVGSPVTGGGASPAAVWSNGTDWKVICA